MVFQWYLFVLLVAVAIFAPAAGQTYTVVSCGQRETRYRWGAVLAIVIPLIYLAGTRDNIGDTGAYRSGFHSAEVSFSQLMAYFAEDTKDKGFAVFTLLLKCFIGDNDKIYFCINLNDEVAESVKGADAKEIAFNIINNEYL